MNLQIQVHPMEYENEDPKITGDISKKSNVGICNVESFFESTDWLNPDNTNTYSMTHPVQSRFVKNMLDCVTIDQLPLDLIEQPTFIKLIRHLNKNILMFSRRTIGSRLKHFYEYEGNIKKCRNIFHSKIAL
ncbi:unnamed protein product [Allacma fusca]|uniref:Uncharacterized protein n=1 Tax=Allacma fusca TaxID=39272 RepID=A0A8J2LM91_9HEXA|nr:unnamed protein product [Allacma fusca]